MTVLLEYILCTTIFLFYIFPIILTLCLMLSVTGTHYTQSYFGIIGGYLFVEVLVHSISSTHKHCNHYFVRICRLWNQCLTNHWSKIVLKKHLKIFMWSHFSNNFNSSNIHSFHFICPCSSCLNSPPPSNFSYLVNYLWLHNILCLIICILCYAIL